MMIKKSVQKQNYLNNQGRAIGALWTIGAPA